MKKFPQISNLKIILSTAVFVFSTLSWAHAAVQNVLQQPNERKASIKILDLGAVPIFSEKEEARKNREEMEAIVFAVLDYLEGEEPYEGDIEISKTADANGHRVVKLENRLFSLQEIFAEWKIVEVKVQNPKGGTAYREEYHYDEWGGLLTFKITAYRPDGTGKASSRLEFVEGLKTHHYFQQFDEKGKRTRFLSETFYPTGVLKTSSDYRYTIGKRFFVKKDRAGKTTLDSIEKLTSSLRAKRSNLRP